ITVAHPLARGSTPVRAAASRIRRRLPGALTGAAASAPLAQPPVEDRPHVQREAGEQRLAMQSSGIAQDLRGSVRTVDMDLAVGGVDQPAELCAIVDILLHLLLQWRDVIRRGADLDHEVRAERE